MTRREWEKQLLINLSSLPKEEQERIASYYDEMYGDRMEAGMKHDEILEEFGSPEECAKKILEEAKEQADALAIKAKYSDENEKTNTTGNGVFQKTANFFSGLTVASVIGIILFAVFVLAPVASILLGVVVTTGAIAFCGAVTGVAGVLFALASPFFAISGMSAGGVFSFMGMGLAGAGIGLLIALAFYFITKALISLSIKAVKALFTRNKNIGRKDNEQIS